MKQLSDTLEAMTSLTVLPKAAHHGSTTNAGQIARSQSLTANQLTGIASHVLRRGFEIVSEEKPKYLETTHSEEPRQVGTETVTDVIADLNQDCSMAMLQTALTVSPRESVLKHLTHLAIHKKFGSSEADRSVLLADYVSALKEYPEYVVYEVCKHYWENDRRPFLPFIGEIKQACEIFKNAISSLLKRKTDSVLVGKAEKEKYYQSPKENPIRRKLCDFLISKGQPDYFDQDRFWSNYDLERSALGMGWDGKTSLPVKSAEEIDKISEITKEALRNLRAG